MRVLILLLAPAALAFAQLDSYSVTITASRPTAVPPDQATFSVSVQTGLSTGFDTVLALLESAGINASNLTGVSTSTSGLAVSQTYLTWTFNLNVPLNSVSAATNSLTQLQQNPAGGSGVSFSLQGVQVSSQLQAAQSCPIPALMMDARVQAQQLAALAGFNLGPVLAMSNSGGAAQPLSYGLIFNEVSGLVSVTTNGLSVPLSSCTIVVKFGLV